jgi:hypothetical protein
VLVGADIVTFVAGTDPSLRAAILNCSLLAQLGAKHKVPSPDDIRNWYDAYFAILRNLGWVIESSGFSEYHVRGREFEARQAILSVATTLLGSATAALAAVASTLESLQESSQGSWVTIFELESQSAKAARFQVTVAQPAPDGGVVTSLMAFELAATKTLTQVLFFKFRSVDAKLRHSSGRVEINAKLLVGLAPAIAERVEDYVRS